jgi:hypothetical protein
VAANFGRDARRSEVEKNTSARGLVSHAVATSPALIRQQWGVMATQWKGLATRRTAGRRRSSVSLSAQPLGRGGSTGGGVTGVEPSSPAVKIPLTPRRYPST